MRQCGTCAAFVSHDETACASCGATLEAWTAAGVTAASDRSTGAAADAKARGQRKELSLDSLFAASTRLVIGRAPDSGICLAHPMVSARHAILERQPDGLRISPYDSARTVIVGGQRIFEPTLVRDRRRFGIGPFLFTLTDNILQCLDSTASLRLEARGLEKVIPLAKGGKRKLLQGVDLVIEPGEFVSLLGPSGSGKSTLMDCMNGRRRATSGKMIANGEDFYAQYHTFRHSLGYVPQKDIVHTQLTVERALRYTARLRLPKDIHEHELKVRVEQVLGQMELLPHRQTLIANLSGGQIKRVSLGAELLAGPSLLYIDEATSGLDAGTESRMMGLFRQLADDGKSVVCITHNVDNVDRCHLILVLNTGRLIYCGPPHDAPDYFGVKRLGQIYDKLAEKKPEEWADQYRQTALYDEFITRRLAESTALEPTPEPPPTQIEIPASMPPATAVQGGGEPPLQMDKTIEFRRLPPRALPPTTSTPSTAVPHPRAASTTSSHRHVTTRSNWYQFSVLTSRYIELLLRDAKSLRLLLLQGPIVGFILAIGLIHLTYTRPMPWNVNLTTEQKSMLGYLHEFNVVLASAEDNTIEADKPKLRNIIFTVADDHGHETARSGYDLAQAIRTYLTMHTAELLPFQIVMGSKEASDVKSASVVKTSDLIGMVHSLAKIDKGHPDRAQQLLDMDSETMPIVPHAEFNVPSACWSVMFLLAITVFWFGCNNAAKEIVREEAIYARERAAGIAIFPYLGSKFVVLSIITVLQVAMLLLVVHGALLLYHADLPLIPGTHQCMYFLSYVAQFGVFSLLGVTGVASGLLISSCVDTPDRANALTPYILIPQIILGGSFIPIEGNTMRIMASVTSPVYWAYRVLHHGTSLLPDYFAPHFHSPDFGLSASYSAMFAQLIVLIVVSAWFLRRKDIGGT